ncbi:autotransporter domain-containing protein [Sphingosinicella sp. YJ22]|uniref:autotransporter domain-containing protein n=1 Tax=Sphingosinicella sp. YJ22 TaxID=1104780 RepID=UPI001409D827|nr:autotransporter domain-containing protein [Sphingosinicella sp. YJ22]
MTKFASRLLATTAMLLAGASIAAPAQAQRVDRIIAFGDSYADDGNFFELTGIPRPAAYPNGRFSNGTNFVDTMSLLLGRPVDNFAIGGAYTGTGNINGIPGLGFQLEYQSFLAGGGPAAFPRVAGTFNPQDLLVISIGGNDARAYRLGGGTVAGASAAAAPRVTEATAGLTALVNAGARNITFLAGDVGRLPEAVGQPSAPAGTAFSSAFNQGMRTSLASFANQGVIVNYLNLNLIGDRVQANPGAYGLQSAGAATAADVAAGRADNFLFYADNVHLTSAGFAIVGAYAVRQLEAPLQLEAQGETVMLAADSFGQSLQDRLDLNSADEAGEGPPLRVFFGADYGQRGMDDTETSLAFRAERWSATGGVEYDGGPWLIGAAASLSQGDTQFLSGTGSVDSGMVQIGAYGSWSSGGLFVEAYGGIGQGNLDIRRDAVIDEIQGQTDADTIVAGGQVGYLFDLGQVRVGPVAGIGYAKAEIDGFTETGDPVLTLNVSDQDVDQLVGSLGVEMNGDFDIGGSRVAPFLSATVDKELDDDPRTILYAATAAPEIVNQWVVAGNDETYGRVSLGANLHITNGLTVQVAGSTTIGQDQGDRSQASVAMRLGF